MIKPIIYLLITQSISITYALNDSSKEIWFKNPATGFDQSLVLGNGRIGAMVFGGTEEERIILNEESMWSGSRAENSIPGGHKNLPEIRKLLSEEKFEEANKLTRESFKVKNGPKYSKQISPFGRYQTLGTLRLTFSSSSEPVVGYERKLDLGTAIGTVTYQRGNKEFTREHFVSAIDDVFVSRISGPVRFKVSLGREERFQISALNDRELLMSGHLNDGFDQDGLQFKSHRGVVKGSW
jgi:alpha-L-fucosidase 2